MADVVIGAKLQLDANDGIKSMKDFKDQIREAKGDLVAMAEKFGENSVQARTAAKKVAELTDALGDAKQLSDSFNPDKKFVALANSLNGVLGGFTALTGAMGLLGMESEDVQKQLLKVQSALALSQGLNQIGDSIQSFKTLGKTIIDTLGKGGAIGLAIAGVGALTAYVTGLIGSVDKLAESEGELVKGVVSAKKEMALLGNTINQAKAGIVSKSEALKAYNDSLGKVTGSTNSLEEAERLLTENGDKYVLVQGLKAQANFLLQQSAEKSAQAELLRMKLAEEDLPRFLRKNIERQIQSDLDGLKTYDDAVKDINNRIKEVKFSVTTSGLGSSFGKEDKKNVSPADQQKKDELKKEYDFGVTKSEIRQNAQLTLLKNDDMFRKMLNDQQVKWDEEDLAKDQEFFDAQYEGWVSNNAAILANEEATAQARITAAQSVGSALGALSELVGKQTAAGKALAIAQATINTWVGVTEVLRAKSVIPEPFGTISKIANVAAIIASGLSAIKNIVKTQVPGAASGGGSVPTLSTPVSPLQPTPQSTNTLLNQQQLNAIGNASVRAFVVESDVTGNQERIRRLNRAARL